MPISVVEDQRMRVRWSSCPMASAHERASRMDCALGIVFWLGLKNFIGRVCLLAGKERCGARAAEGLKKRPISHIASAMGAQVTPVFYEMQTFFSSADGRTKGDMARDTPCALASDGAGCAWGCMCM